MSSSSIKEFEEDFKSSKKGNENFFSMRETEVFLIYSNGQKYFVDT